MDIQYLLLLQNFRDAIGGFLNSFFAFITMIAVDYYAIVPALIIFWTVSKRKGVTVLGAYGTGGFFNALLKVTFCVYRPWIRSDQLKPLPEVMAGATGYSFPSGHSTSAGGFYGGLIAVYRKHKGLCIFFSLMILLTMFSRNYVGVHTPQDVLVGAATGLLCAVLVSHVLNWIDRNPEKDWIVLVVSIIACVAVLLYIFFKSYPETYVDGVLLVDPKKMTVDGFKDPGRFFGIVLGWFIERRFVKFDVSGTSEQKVLRALAGGLLFVFYMTAVADPIGKAIGFGPMHFLLQMCGPLLFMTVYPIIFKKLER